MAKFDGVLFASDMDGTLLNNKHEVSRENEEAILYFTENGGAFTIASGRMVGTIAPYTGKIKITAPIIANNGAVVYDLAQNKPLRTMPLGADFREIVKKLMEDFPELGIEVNTADDLYICQGNDVTRRHSEIIKRPHAITGVDEITGECMKLNLMQETGYLDRVERYMNTRYPGMFYLVNSDPCYLEILNPGVNKGIGLNIVAGVLHIAREHIYSIGDNYNDIELLENAGTAFAPSNAEQQLKDIADVIVSTNNEHAVQQAITHIDKRYG